MSDDIGLPWFQGAPGCDAGPSAGVYMYGNEMRCRCLVCARCDHHTGNSHQGHYWSMCRVTKRTERPHFCCPNDCELQGKSA